MTGRSVSLVLEGFKRLPQVERLDIASQKFRAVTEKFVECLVEKLPSRDSISLSVRRAARGDHRAKRLSFWQIIASFLKSLRCEEGSSTIPRLVVRGHKALKCAKAIFLFGVLDLALTLFYHSFVNAISVQAVVKVRTLFDGFLVVAYQKHLSS